MLTNLNAKKVDVVKMLENKTIEELLTKEELLKIKGLNFIYRANCDSDKWVYWWRDCKEIYRTKIINSSCPKCNKKGLPAKNILKNLRTDKEFKHQANKDYAVAYNEMMKTLIEAFNKCKICKNNKKLIYGYNKESCQCSEVNLNKSKNNEIITEIN